jgi:hypothetical protein
MPHAKQYTRPKQCHLPHPPAATSRLTRMLRRVVRSLRALLLTMGLLLLAWLPASFFVEVTGFMRSRSSSHGGLAFVRNGYLCVMLSGASEDQHRQFPLLGPPADAQPSQKQRDLTPPASSGSRFDAGFEVVRIVDFRNIRPVCQLLPSYQRGMNSLDATLPLWFLAVACLVWPVMLFVIRWRKQKKGFAINPSARP